MSLLASLATRIFLEGRHKKGQKQRQNIVFRHAGHVFRGWFYFRTPSSRKKTSFRSGECQPASTLRTEGSTANSRKAHMAMM